MDFFWILKYYIRYERSISHGSSMYQFHSPRCLRWDLSRKRLRPHEYSTSRGCGGCHDYILVNTPPVLFYLVGHRQVPRKLFNGNAPAREVPKHHDDGDFVKPSSLFGPRPDSWWTGRSPSEEGEVPGRRPDGTIVSLPQLMLRDCTKQVRRDFAPQPQAA